MTHGFQPGQRWISKSEPELGLGAVRAVGPRTVTVSFKAAEETREYALGNAPLRRAAFRAGDLIRSADNRDLTVDSVTEQAGLLYYDCGPLRVCETSLSPTLSFSSPLKRLFAGQFDESHVFDLRRSALGHQYRRRKSEVRGFLGGRIDLLPHQLSIASEVTRRIMPRVLLADEVGLGKTIEACLILHRLLLTGRASRALILVPESLIHQWFLELLRRFALWFHIFDEARCQAIEEARPGTNPFLDNQLILCDLTLLTRSAGRLQQALDAGWDLLVVDEAHHLGWSPEAASPEYAAVETIGGRTPGLLLLTATPEQLGVASHFARLRLLDPDRFYDLDVFTHESEEYRSVARLAERLKAEHALSPEDSAALARILGESTAAVSATLERTGPDADQARAAWVEALIDQHGTGRVMFRNTRATIAGFPVRVAHLHPLSVSSTETSPFKALAREWAADSDVDAEESFRPHYTHDPRIEWLAALMRTLGQQKILLICHTQRKAMAIEAALKQRTTTKVAAFHEGLTLVQRDRGAAWFADRDGARLLICSEIGSEGRNFQFAHHLVLFDLPLDPALLEQRIGRLDRIGQTAPIQVHVPYVAGSHQEVLARWYHEGLCAFEEHLQGGRELLERFGADIRQFAGGRPRAGAQFESRPGAPADALSGGLEAWLARVRESRLDVAARLEQGRDRLLEWNSFRPEVSTRLIEEIHHQDELRTLDDFMLLVLDLFFIEVEEFAPRTFRLGSAGALLDAFPGLTPNGLTVTCDRARALAREDLHFLTWDHPLVTGALDLLLGSEHGNCSFARWVDDKTSGVYLEALYVLECIAPPQFHLDRFLPPTPLRVVADHRGQDASEAMPEHVVGRHAPGEGQALLERPDIRETLLPRLVDRTRQLAEGQAGAIVAQARQDMASTLERERSRLRDLQRVNRSIRDEEIDLLARQQRALDEYIGQARIRLDALRLIHRGPQR